MKTKERFYKMELVKSKKYRDPSWDFQAADTKQYTHCFHTYPAMMIPQVAGRILDEFKEGAKLLFDPYCGTGTSLVEANLRGINAVGTDVNPLARMIAKVKTTVISIKLLDKYLKNFNDFLFEIRFGRRRNEFLIPYFENIDYWFKKETQYWLAAIKEYIEKEIEDLDIQDFFKVAFSETIREVSLTRNSEFKLYRMPEEQIARFNPDVFAIMMAKLERNRKGMIEFIQKKRNNSFSTIYDFDTVKGIPDHLSLEESVDIIVTSPPYGDSRTTVAYGQFSRLSNQWLGFEKANKVDKKCMGGKKQKTIRNFGIKILDEILENIKEIDPKRFYDVASFYIDYEKSIQNVSKLVKKRGIVAYVVGNRRVKGIEIPTDEITRALFERYGFAHLGTIIRKIPNKRMPKRNSPTNKPGITDSTMNYEYIVLLKKL